MCRPYSVLHPVGFAVPRLLPAARCALAAPFRPYRPEGRRYAFCGTFPDPSPKQKPPGVTRHRRSVEPGLSSPALAQPRPPGPLTAARYGLLRPRQQEREQFGAAFAVDDAVDHGRAGSGAGRRSPPSAGRSRHSRTARARAGSRRRSSTGPSGRGSGSAAPGGAWPARPTGTARPDPPCAPGRCREWPTTLPRPMPWRSLMSATSGISAAICSSGNGR